MSELGGQMRALADTGHERALELKEKAEAFDVAAAGFYAEPQTIDVKKFMGAWARARRCYSECAGVPLIGGV